MTDARLTIGALLCTELLGVWSVGVARPASTPSVTSRLASVSVNQGSRVRSVTGASMATGTSDHTDVRSAPVTQSLPLVEAVTQRMVNVNVFLESRVRTVMDVNPITFLFKWRTEPLFQHGRILLIIKKVAFLALPVLRI